MIISGKVFVANSSLVSVAQLHCSDEGWLQLQHEQGSVRAKLSELELSMAIGNQPRAVSFSNGDRFVADQPQRLNAWLDKHAKHSLVKYLERNLLVIMFAVVFSCGALYLSIEQGLPRLSKYLAAHLPEAIALELGERTLAHLESVGFEPSTVDPIKQQQIQQQFQALVTGIGTLSPEPQLLFYKLGEEANAFTLANGSIIVSDQLVGLMQQPEQLNGILLHELAHVANNDVMASLVRSTIVSTAIVLMVGDSSLLVDGLMSGAVLGLSSGYSREAETQADLFACQWSHKLGLPQQQLMAGYQVLFAHVESDIPTWMSSHPGDEERLMRLESCVKSKQ